ncbi:SWI/SNF-related matrix-associated actin-dependent regulator of chromatin subfamily A containing DEAD/H box 1 homolog [Thrips palmi]|uniref:SWI/SNF-related matrix-associated actin-dependent regulator of chromatin subfamily A containing DEAD/H box 1 homolog n=1 Tax=Thrips palmi TaxID=161013 RepID=A0A6P9ADP4_THRPL|nr:SWI/SNF-related matrix-associated actin-dependent regulator of chromatin subfamily A containing DEAD/H box 1 homolog [Thrips palmi]XP_034255615.1 SWI/SNF-related matrix-associated actin-dependent regulator of chromatin subfamily A containing DEAD/H box 1 homolog [Thrips palmi]XP_034255616.1 SWI/SNF-related matrix-associated actin-dependent regulator of chromatin subfamily A containing DEAD/H box 1 homolog [Thrips palmi]XP_034255617.1 SWI/SNF-related matrix-associated actin-dependent regulator
MSGSTKESSPSEAANPLLESLRRFKFLKKSLLDSQNLPPAKSKSNPECVDLDASDNEQHSKKNKEKELSSGSTLSVSSPTKQNGIKFGDESPPDSPVKPGKRKAKVLSSDTEDESPKPNGVRGSKKRKSIEVDEEGRTSVENALIQLLSSFPGQDILILQDALSRAKWDVEQAKIDLAKRLSDDTANTNTNTNGSAKTPTTNKKVNGSSKASKKKRKADLDSCEEDNETDEDDDGRGFKKTKLYDSDADSDEEISDEMTDDKRQVLNFLSEADVGELYQMSNCSKKKAELIIECRPFEGWKDTVEKLEKKSGLGAGILNSAQELLRTRKVAASLIKKCSKLSSQMETAISTGLSNLHKKPSIMSENLKLSDYQLVGLNWLLMMNTHQVNGILADEMGLGKTVQVIAFLSYLKENKLNIPGKPHIVVVPSSTLENWQNEFKRWSPSLNVVVYHGNQEDRKYQRIEWSKEGFGDTEVVLTTYAMVTSVSEERKMFRVIPLHYAIFDEAHMLKNMYTQRFENLIKINAPNRILITGTPLQNNLLELMSLLVFVMPKMFKGKQETLKTLFTKAPKQIKDDSESAMPNFERTQIAQAKHIMKPFVLRRLKRDVLKDLPKKTEEILKCPMTKDQERTYKDLIADFSKQANEELNDEQSEPSESGMAMYMKLRRQANHPLLLRHHFTEDILKDMAKRLQADVRYKDVVFDYILDDLYFLSDFDLHKLCLEYKSCYSLRLPPSVMGESGKLIEIDRMLPKLKGDGHRVLIFSQFVIVLDVLEEHFKNKGYKFLRLDGNTPVTTRQDLIDEYNQDPSILIFMLSTRAGGLGINLTTADTVIIHDIDSNPHNDKQAEDRCHRIGQTKPVKVIRLVSEGTIEESILVLSQEKLLLEQEVSGNEDNEQSEKKNVARLLKQALGLDNKSSPSSSKQLSKSNSK